MMSQWDPWEQKPALQSIRLPGLELRNGDRVILRPKKGGDIMDLALAGRVAVIESIEQDLEDRVHVAVIVEDDPGHDLGMLRQPGHRFFFSPEELEPAPNDTGARPDT
jgi:hypothetical protein